MAVAAFADEGVAPDQVSAIIRADLERTKVQGVAYDHQESYDGLACVAAPVRGAGRAVAAVSVTGPVARIDLHAVAPLVQMAAQAIWADRFRKR